MRKFYDLPAYGYFFIKVIGFKPELDGKVHLQRLFRHDRLSQALHLYRKPIFCIILSGHLGSKQNS